jgi:transglutaminase/protease-like cytokinesis protein 3
MPTEREYKEWQAKRKRYSRKRPINPQINSSLLWLIGVIFLSAWLSWKDNRSSFKLPDLQKFTQKPEYTIKPSSISKPSLESKPTQHIETGSKNLINNTNFSALDSLAFSINYYGTSVEELAAILSPYAKTELEKARIIYAWIADNIDYDVPAYLSGNYGDVSPENVLQTRKSVCSGYANLYKAVAKAMGLDAVVIEGYSKGSSYVIGSATEINHAWNGVKINNSWYLLDATWGAGTVEGGQFNKRFNPYYFATNPEQLIYDHFPAEVTWQLLPQPYTKIQFDFLPKVSPQFFKNGLKLVSHHTHTIQADDRVQIILESPPNTRITASLKQGELEIAKNYTIQQQTNGKAGIIVAFPAAGNYELQIFSKNQSEGESNFYPLAVTYKIIAKGKSEPFPHTYTTFSEHQAYLSTPLSQFLPANQIVQFQINVPNALEVQVLDEFDNNWTPLTQSGNSFIGSLKVGSGKIKILAKFPGSDKYWGLVEYN